MPEPVTTREEQLTARATKAGLTLIHPPADAWLVIYDPNASWDACVDLDEAEEIIEANEGGVEESSSPPEEPPWL